MGRINNREREFSLEQTHRFVNNCVIFVLQAVLYPDSDVLRDDTAGGFETSLKRHQAGHEPHLSRPTSWCKVNKTNVIPSIGRSGFAYRPPRQGLGAEALKDMHVFYHIFNFITFFTIALETCQKQLNYFKVWATTDNTVFKNITANLQIRFSRCELPHG